MREHCKKLHQATIRYTFFRKICRIVLRFSLMRFCMVTVRFWGELQLSDGLINCNSSNQRRSQDSLQQPHVNSPQIETSIFSRARADDSELNYCFTRSVACRAWSNHNWGVWGFKKCFGRRRIRPSIVSLHSTLPHVVPSQWPHPHRTLSHPFCIFLFLEKKLISEYWIFTPMGTVECGATWRSVVRD
jgi:hypothetical protein